jgi:YhcH/YjgK/YiaL family protein
MIVDNIKNTGLYMGISHGIEKALKYLRETDFTAMKPGKYEIDGSNIYAIVQEYDTRPLKEGKWEAHKKYIDVQYVMDGAEQMGYAFIENLDVTEEYEPEKDCLFLKGDGSMLMCNTGTFVIFGPDDAHMPCMAIDKPMPVKKVVVKVHI